MLFGEVFGAGVQDLAYGASKPTFRLFDAAVVKSHEDYVFLEYEQLLLLAEDLQIEMAPFLYVGPYSEEEMANFTDGQTTIKGANHIREGIVAKTIKNIYNPYTRRWERKVAKSVSEAYHERKGSNLTEFQ